MQGSDIRSFTIKDKSGAVHNGEDVFAKHKLVAIYFSAHWCPPCRAFTPKLAAAYNAIKASDRKNDVEIVFFSRDKDQTAFEDYYKDHPWLTYELNQLNYDIWKQTYQISGIPTLVVLDSTGKVKSLDATVDLEGDDVPADFFDRYLN